MPNFEGYENLEKIAEGKDRTVYSALRVADHTSVILKTLHSDHPNIDLIALMYHEFEVAKDINYPGIIKTYGLIDQQTPAQAGLFQTVMEVADRFDHLAGAQQQRVRQLILRHRAQVLRWDNQACLASC